eukprot:Opistho-1_new@12581
MASLGVLRGALVVAVICVLLNAVSVSAQDCTTKTTCRDCLNDPRMPQCGWCGTTGSCLPVASAAQCSLSSWIYNTSRITKVGATTVDDEVVPKSLSVFLRAGEEFTVRVDVKPQACKPVDLYLLMDFSGSMGDDLDKVKSLASPLTTTTVNLCKDACNDPKCARIGMESFVEKPRYPAGYWTLSNYWSEKGGTVPVNSVFRSRLPLSSNYNDFQDKLTSIPSDQITGNNDWAEDPFEAMMQVLRCRKLTDWASRDSASKQPRRIILVLTDADYHLRGEGASLGINDPNPGTCYVDESDLSNMDKVNQQIDTTSLLYDYPTLTQVRNALIETNTVPIFAAVPGRPAISSSDNEKAYSNVRDGLGFGYYAVLSSDSDNILSVVSQSYASIASRLSMAVAQNGNQKLVKSISPDPATGYDSVTTGKTYTFNITLQDDGSLGDVRNALVKLSILGFGSVEINVTRGIDCSTPCAGFCQVNGQQKCGDLSRGTCECGRCTCQPGYEGTNCECDARTLCNVVNGAECNGQGSCKCGKCQCRAPFKGENCTCFDGACPSKPANLICSGHGTCDCGSCKCDAGWTQADCSCKTGVAAVCGISIGNCNNHGKCNTCGQCECDPGWKGTVCDVVNPVCPNNCSNHGICAGAGQCNCLDGYTGSDCACPPCAPVCVERGTCECGICVSCYLGYDKSTNCECVDASQVPCNPSGTVGGKANCNGQCECKQGWEGDTCACRSDSKCPSSIDGGMCSGHGTCDTTFCDTTVVPPKFGTCNCFVGYKHSNDSNPICDCSEAECPGSDATGTVQCYGHGSCVCGKCVCNPGYASDTNCRCPTNATCPLFRGQQCGGSDHGSCVRTPDLCDVPVQDGGGTSAVQRGQLQLLNAAVPH